MSRFQSLPLFERLCGTLAMEPACLHVKLTFGYGAGLSLSDSVLVHTGVGSLGSGVGAVAVV